MPSFFTKYLGQTQGRIQPQGHEASIGFDGSVVDGTTAEVTAGNDGPYNLPGNPLFQVAIDKGPAQTIVLDSSLFADPAAATPAEVGAQITSQIRPAKLTTNVGPFVLVAGQTLPLRVNGAAEIIYTVDAADFASIEAASASELAAAMDAAYSGVSVAARGGRVVISSDTLGVSATLEVSDEPLRANLGLLLDVSVGSNDVEVETSLSNELVLRSTTPGPDGCIQVFDPGLSNANQELEFTLEEVCGERGQWVMVMGFDGAGHVVPLSGGDFMRVRNVPLSAPYESGDQLIRMKGRARFAKETAANLSWFFAFGIDGTSSSVYPMDTPDIEEVSLEDLAVNVADIGPPDSLLGPEMTLAVNGTGDGSMEMPSIYIDAVELVSGLSDDVAVINRLPHPNQRNVPADLAQLRLTLASIEVGTGGPSVDLTATQVFIEDTLVYDGGAGGFQAPHTGTVTPAQGPTSRDVNMTIDLSNFTFESGQEVDVRVISETA